MATSPMSDMCHAQRRRESLDGYVQTALPIDWGHGERFNGDAIWGQQWWGRFMDILSFSYPRLVTWVMVCLPEMGRMGRVSGRLGQDAVS